MALSNSDVRSRYRFQPRRRLRMGMMGKPPAEEGEPVKKQPPTQDPSALPPASVPPEPDEAPERGPIKNPEQPPPAKAPD